MSYEFDKAAALAWIRKSLMINHGKYPPFVLCDLDAQIISKVKAIGLDVANRQLALDYDGVRHTYVKHGNKLIETARRQRAIVAADFLLIPNILEVGAFQIGDPAQGRDGTKRLAVHAALLNDGANETFNAVFSIRKKLVVLHTMWVN
jgi:hypothetical protein